MKMKSEDVDRIVARIDETRHAEHWRDSDRPSGRAFRERGRQDPAIGRAKTRLRTQHWRVRMDQAKRPSTHQIGAALVYALVISDAESMSRTDWGLVGRALADLQARGFDLGGVKASLRRLRNRMVDPGDREGEPGESTGAPIEPSAWAGTSPIF
jgi:hypothetical protein